MQVCVCTNLYANLCECATVCVCGCVCVCVCVCVRVHMRVCTCVRVCSGKRVYSCRSGGPSCFQLHFLANLEEGGTMVRRKRDVG